MLVFPTPGSPNITILPSFINKMGNNIEPVKGIDFSN